MQLACQGKILTKKQLQSCILVSCTHVLSTVMYVHVHRHGKSEATDCYPATVCAITRAWWEAAKKTTKRISYVITSMHVSHRQLYSPIMCTTRGKKHKKVSERLRSCVVHVHLWAQFTDFSSCPKHQYKSSIAQLFATLAHYFSPSVDKMLISSMPFFLLITRKYP